MDRVRRKPVRHCLASSLDRQEEGNDSRNYANTSKKAKARHLCNTTSSHEVVCREGTHHAPYSRYAVCYTITSSSNCGRVHFGCVHTCHAESPHNEGTCHEQKAHSGCDRKARNEQQGNKETSAGKLYALCLLPSQSIYDDHAHDEARELRTACDEHVDVCGRVEWRLRWISWAVGTCLVRTIRLLHEGGEENQSIVCHRIDQPNQPKHQRRLSQCSRKEGLDSLTKGESTRACSRCCTCHLLLSDGVVTGCFRYSRPNKV
mmetsp:Transcript_47809/g.124069  ORF Transcript_47809/g.124069 Transcript_47809/m.124069 type:complete len:261 (+) Transcript_47809:689-1471(+)